MRRRSPVSVAAAALASPFAFAAFAAFALAFAVLLTSPAPASAQPSGRGGLGGFGGIAQATVPVTPGEMLLVDVGDNGHPTPRCDYNAIGGSGGLVNESRGGNGGRPDCSVWDGGGGGGGGGASEVGRADGSLLIAAGGGGGGGGAGCLDNYNGGAGGNAGWPSTPTAPASPPGPGGSGSGNGSGAGGPAREPTVEPTYTNRNGGGDSDANASSGSSGGGGGGGGGGRPGGNGGRAGSTGCGGGGGGAGGWSMATGSGVRFSLAPTRGQGEITISEGSLRDTFRLKLDPEGSPIEQTFMVPAGVYEVHIKAVGGAGGDGHRRLPQPPPEPGSTTFHVKNDDQGRALKQTFIVPPRVHEVRIEAVGGGGGDGSTRGGLGRGGRGGRGGVADDLVSVLPGESLTVWVGDRGANAGSRCDTNYPGAAGGLDDKSRGGPGGKPSCPGIPGLRVEGGAGGGGGGASEVARANGSLLIAGGGGGAATPLDDGGPGGNAGPTTNTTAPANGQNGGGPGSGAGGTASSSPSNTFRNGTAGGNYRASGSSAGGGGGGGGGRGAGNGGQGGTTGGGGGGGGAGGWSMATGSSRAFKLAGSPKAGVVTISWGPGVRALPPPSQAAYLRAESVSEDNSDWLAHVSGHWHIWQLSIPGTHDSYSRIGGDSAQTQTLPGPEQLKMGIRAFDLRLKANNSGGYSVFHGPYYQDITLNGVLNQVSTFLHKHPSEFVIVRFIVQDKGRDFDTRMPRILESYNNILWRNPSGNGGAFEDPTLNQVRGRVILLREVSGESFPAITPYGMNCCGPHAARDFVVQDAFTLTSFDKLYAKWDGKGTCNDVTKPCGGETGNVLDNWRAATRYAATGGDQRAYVNFLSGTSPTACIAGTILNYPCPFFVASGFTSAGCIAAADDLTSCQRDTGMTEKGETNKTHDKDFHRQGNCATGCKIVSTGINLLMYDVLSRQNRAGDNHRSLQQERGMGLIYMDFPGSPLVDGIINNKSRRRPHRGDQVPRQHQPVRGRLQGPALQRQQGATVHLQRRRQPAMEHQRQRKRHHQPQERHYRLFASYN